MKTTLGDDVLGPISARLSAANQRLISDYPGESGERQPVHTVYGGAHLFKADLAAKLGRLALRSLSTYGKEPEGFAEAVGLLARGERAAALYRRVQEKLGREPVEDFRIDFEDGYGNRPDEEEDKDAVGAADQVSAGHKARSLPPFIGIRIKPLSDELARRSFRTLDIFVSRLVENGTGLPANFIVTLPKITSVEQVELFVEVCAALESKLGLPERSLLVEFMIEVTQSIMAPDGGSNLPRFLAAADGRCRGAHFGTYDYTASCSVTADEQRMQHPVCDFAKHMMQVAYAGRGIWLSDGATNIMPVPMYKAKEGEDLTTDQSFANIERVHNAWRLHVSDVTHGLRNGFYQGWDLHPGQLPTRYAALYDFFLQGLESASERLKNFIGKAAQATLVGDVFDDAATGQGLLNFFLRGISCGAFEESEALATGITIEELRGRSFASMMKNRRGD